MFQEKMNNFKELESKYELLVASLNEQQKELEQKITQNKESYHRAMMTDIEDGTKKSQAELSRHLRYAEEYERQLEDIQKRIEIAGYLKREKLKELLPVLKIAKDKAIQEATKEINENKAKGFELKAQYILFARDLNEPYRRAKDIQAQFLASCHSVGVHDFDRDFISLPTLNIASTYEGLHSSLAPTMDEIMDAYTRGKLPYFVQLYDMTGEILPENDAREKLEQLRKEVGKNE